MNFEDWQTLQKEEQERLVHTWMANNQGGQYMRLAHSAAIALKDLLSTHREITGVHLGCGEIIYQDPQYPGIRESEIVLEVCTNLHGCPVLTFVPTQFGGFRVALNHLGDKRAQYIATWTRLFHELMGWDERKTLEWAKPMEDKLNGREDSIVYHDGPIKTALPTLLAEVKGKADDWQAVNNELLRVIWPSEKEGGETIDHPDRILDYDWDYVRRRYEEILARYR